MLEHTHFCVLLHLRVITLLWVSLNEFVFRDFSSLKAIQLRRCQFMTCSRVPLFICSVLSVDDLSCWLHCSTCLPGNLVKYQEPSTPYSMYSMHTAHAQPALKVANRCGHTQYSTWQNGMTAAQTVHKLQLCRMKISTGWVGFLCQRRTFSVGRWMMEEMEWGGGLRVNTHTHTQAHNGPILKECKTSVVVYQDVSALKHYSLFHAAQTEAVCLLMLLRSYTAHELKAKWCHCPLQWSVTQHTDQVQLLFSFVCYQGFNTQKGERERKKRKEGGGDKQAQ